jgi:MYXO-CTERM domain-containing protein
VTVGPGAGIRLSGPASAASSPLALETVALGRGTPSAAAPTTARIDRDGSVVASRGAARERVTPRLDGVEQLWEFDARPPGRGDLVVRVRPTGAAFEQASGNGLRFVDASHGTHFRYESAAWVDASGTRTSLPMQLSGGDIELVVPARLVDESTYPAVLDPIVGVEFELEAPLFVPSTQSGVPGIASDGTDYLVTWAADAIYAARVTSAGVLQQPPRITVGAGGAPAMPRAVWDGTEWYVVWACGGVCGTRLASDGTLIDTTPQTLVQSSSSSSPLNVDVASDGHQVFVVWDTTDGTDLTSQVHGTLLTPGGTPGAPQLLSTAAVSQRSPRVVYDGTEYFVAWQDARASGSIASPSWDIYGARVSPSGVLVDASGIAISTATGDQTAPAIASSGADVFIAWQDGRAGMSPWQLYGARFSPATGAIDDGPPSTGGILLDTNYDSSEALAYDGQQYVLAWRTASSSGAVWTTQLERVSTAGAVVGSPTTVDPASGIFYFAGAGIGGSSSGSLVVSTGSSGALYGNRVDRSGNLVDGALPGGGFVISEEPSTKNFAAAAFNGTDYLVAWSDDREGANVGLVYAVRVDPGGSVLDSSAFPIATGRGTIDAIKVASNGTGWAVVWDEWSPTTPNEQFVRVVGPDGSLVNGPASADGIPLTCAAIASDGKDYLCVWTGANNNLYAKRFSQAAQVYPAPGSSDGSFAVASENSAAPSLAFDGQNYLLAWLPLASYPNGTASRLTTTGQRLDGALDGPGFSLPAAGHGELLAFDGSHFLAASTGVVDIVVPPSGAVAQSPSSLAYPSSALYDGASFWVFDSGNGIRFRDDATIVDTTPVVAEDAQTASDINSAMAAATDGQGHILVVYPVGRDFRARILVDDDRNGTPCSVGDSCASGVCEDGVCCDHPCGGSTTDCRACSIEAGSFEDGVCATAVAGHVCRPRAACDLAGICDGTTTACPPDDYLGPYAVCGDAGACTAAPLCSGTSAACLPGLPLTDGSPCGAGGTCSGGACNEPVIDAGNEGGSGAQGGDGSVAAEAGNEAGAGEAGADAGSAADSAVVDAAGGAPDAGGGSGDSSGCACRTAPAEAGRFWAAPLVMLGLLLGRRAHTRHGRYGAGRKGGAVPLGRLQNLSKNWVDSGEPSGHQGTADGRESDGIVEP